MHHAGIGDQGGLKQPVEKQPKCAYAMLCCGVLQSSVHLFILWLSGLGCCGNQPGGGQGHCFSCVGLKSDWPGSRQVGNSESTTNCVSGHKCV
jgi:hypothetical protein